MIKSLCYVSCEYLVPLENRHDHCSRVDIDISRSNSDETSEKLSVFRELEFLISG
jgi:hypothetical protein